MKLLIIKNLFFAIFLSVALSSTNSIIDRKDLAKTYYESELYEDAIFVFEEILGSFHLFKTKRFFYR